MKAKTSVHYIKFKAKKSINTSDTLQTR